MAKSIRKLRNDLTGKRFGRLEVLKRVDLDAKHVHWSCKCDCGKIHKTRTDNLTSGRTTSCGCYARERSITHGMRNTVIYRKWVGLRQRCNDKNCPQYPRYGGRGIKVCARWDDFMTFYGDVGLPPTGRHQPDRINNDGDYEPGNFRWATPRQNANNKSDTVYLDYDGRTQSISDWAREFGIRKSTMQYRHGAGWSMEKIATTRIDTGKAVGGRYKRT